MLPDDSQGGQQSANEGDRFKQQGQQSSERPAYIPEKFWKDGKPDLESLGKSYGEIETRFNTKTEELRKQLDADRLKSRPEAADKYALPKIDGVDEKALAESPILGFWRETSFNMGLDQKSFDDGVSRYIQAMNAAAPDLEAEVKKLGDNGSVRIKAVETWANAAFTDPSEFAAVQQIANSAAGIKVLERFMARQGAGDGNAGGEGGAAPQLTLHDLQKMQSDPRYWDQGRREPAFIKQVDEGFQKLYPSKKS